MSWRPEDLLQRIGEIQRKTEENRNVAANARDAAGSALETATEVEEVSVAQMCVCVPVTNSRQLLLFFLSFRR